MNLLGRLSSRAIVAAALALLAQPAAAELSDAARAYYQARLADSAAGRFDAVSAAPLLNVPHDPVLDDVLRWDRLRRDSYAGTFPEYWGLLRARPDWPQAVLIRRQAEKAIDATVSPADRLAYFKQFPPLSALAKLRLAEALQASGRGAEAAQAARDAWDSAGLDADGETQLLAQFAPAITPDDDVARADRLLWSNQTTAAQRLLTRLPMDRKLWLLTRLAYRTGASDAPNRLAGMPASLRDDPGLLLERALWLRRQGSLAEARRLLADTPVAPGTPLDAEIWLKTRLDFARAAWRDGDSETAYRILARNAAFPLGRPLTERTLGERQAFVETEWLAGWLALRKLNRPAGAIAHFQNVRSAAQTPLTQSRADYWTGRAAEAAGRREEARAAYEAAAAHPDYFYGQLATEALKRPLVLVRGQPAPVDPARLAAFRQDGLVLAAQRLGELGDRSRQTLFLRAIADRAQSPEDYALAASLVQPLGRPDLGVMLGKAARADGELAMVDLAYPQLALPPNLASGWSMTHAIARQESQFDRAAVSAAGARGLMQLLPGTAAEQAAKLGLPYSLSQLTDDTVYNATIGSAYLARLRDNFDGSHVLAVAAYNAGPGNARKFIAANGDPRSAGVDTIDWIETIPISETRNYVQRVLENAVVYDLLRPQTALSPPKDRLSWYLGRR
jgi:soluble lytic murein transglycosylase